MGSDPLRLALLSRPSSSISGGWCVTVPTVRVWMAPPLASDSTRARPKSAT